MITRKRASQIMAGFARKKILVIGDLMLDRYVIGTVSRISPEAPVPVVLVTKEHALPGGAANVALNIQSLGGQVVVAGVVGADRPAEELTSLLKGRDILTDGMVVCNGLQTTVKTRVLAERQQVVRVDREDFSGMIEGLTDRLVERILTVIDEVSGVIIEDYSKGVVCQRVVSETLRVCAKRRIPVGFDPKDNRSLRIRGLTLATPNLKEAYINAGVEESPLRGAPEDDKALVKAAAILQRRWNTDILMITLGAHGMYLLPRKGKPVVIPARAREVFDVSGAGDTVIATAMLALASGASYFEAGSLANYAAGVVVAKVGTATCSPGELLASM
jgi:D-beta-D-heptose 7-phosphate kinase/D-beta-D-heptose 1-phosphate adenosyltransferase